jgi:hypothetical protein
MISREELDELSPARRRGVMNSAKKESETPPVPFKLPHQKACSPPATSGRLWLIVCFAVAVVFGGTAVALVSAVPPSGPPVDEQHSFSNYDGAPSVADAGATASSGMDDIEPAQLGAEGGTATENGAVRESDPGGGDSDRAEEWPDREGSGMQAAEKTIVNSDPGPHDTPQAL